MVTAAFDLVAHPCSIYLIIQELQASHHLLQLFTNAAGNTKQYSYTFKLGGVGGR